MNKLLSFFTILLAGCAAPLAESPAFEPVSVVSFVFVDQRPQVERISRSGAETRGTVLFGDEALKPNVAETLKAALQSRLSDRLGGKRVVLNSAEVSLSAPDVTVDVGRVTESAPRTAAGVVAAPVAGVLIGLVESARSRKYVYVRLEGTVDGRTFRSSMSEQYPGRVTSDHIQSTVRSAAILASLEIEKGL